MIRYYSPTKNLFKRKVQTITKNIIFVEYMWCYIK